MALIARKKETGKDLIRTSEQTAEVESAEEGDVDLLDTIRRSLRSGRPAGGEDFRTTGGAPRGGEY